MARIYSSAPKWTGTIGSGGVADGSTTTISLASASGLTNGQYYILSIDRIDASGNLTPTKWEVVAGQLSGSNLINCTRGVEGTAQAHSAGATVELLFTSYHWTQLKSTFETEHNSSGNHTSATVTTLKASGSEVNTGTEDAKIVTPKAIADSNVVFTTKTQTLTNKTLNSPVINNPTGDVATLTGAQTLTNKRITKRVYSTTSSSTPTPDIDSYDVYILTALAANATFGAPTGTPTQGQTLIIRVKDNGTARTLSFNSIYRFSADLPAPTTTIVNKTLYMGFIYNSTDTKWDCLAILNNF